MQKRAFHPRGSTKLKTKRLISSFKVANKHAGWEDEGRKSFASALREHRKTIGSKATREKIRKNYKPRVF